MRATDIIERIIATLQSELSAATAAARETAGEATDDESRPENKYDTRALEASYVASAQAHYAKDLAEALQAYRNLALPPEDINAPVALGRLVTTLSPQGRETYFIGPARGGLEIPIADETVVTVLTPQSPLGAQLLGKRVGGRTEGTPSRAIIRVQ